jgi:hypothetical protein
VAGGVRAGGYGVCVCANVVDSGESDMRNTRIYFFAEIMFFGYGLAVMFSPKRKSMLLKKESRFSIGKITILRPPKDDAPHGTYDRVDETSSRGIGEGAR